MARGRMLNKTVSMSKQMDDLPDDTCRLLATWTLSHLDVNGVFHADPVLVRSMIFPRRQDVTVEQVERYLIAMESVGLIIRFDACGEPWQWWPKFRDNQAGLRADRETTNFPDPPECPQDDGDDPASIPQDDGDKYAEEKLSKENRSEVKAGADAPNDDGKEDPPQHPHSSEQWMTPTEVRAVMDAWGRGYRGVPNEEQFETMDEYAAELDGRDGVAGVGWIVAALRQAALSNNKARGPTLGFALSILDRWKDEGFEAPYDPNGHNDDAQFDSGMERMQEWVLENELQAT